MRIDQLVLENFRKFERLTLELPSPFTLLVGGNGSGKTTVLEALAISLHAWLVFLGEVKESGRVLQLTDKRLVSEKTGDRVQFQEKEHTAVIVRSEKLEWGQTYNSNLGWHAPDNVGVTIQNLYKENHLSLCPVLAFYGVSRASRPAQSSSSFQIKLDPPRRWDAYRYWYNPQIEYDNLRKWFYQERAARGDDGLNRPGYEVVREAILGCVPGANELWFDVNRADLICSIDGAAQPLTNLSDGQRMLLAMVADIAIKAVTLNAHLIPSETLGSEDDPIPRVLKETPGVVLIDELDLHLHPSWQRRVVADLKRTFPAMQFVATTHSPQIIGEVLPNEISIIDGEMVYSPDRSYGMDASRVLEEIMDTKRRAEPVEQLLAQLSSQISDDKFDEARLTIQQAARQIGEDDPELTSARALISFVEQR